MKIASFPYLSSDFYLKPDTALAKPQDDYFIPPFCGGMAYSVCYVVKINRLGRFIEPRFALRYCGEWNVGVCLYGIPQDCMPQSTNVSANGEVSVDAFPHRFRLLDYSLPMPREFFTEYEAAAQVIWQLRAMPFVGTLQVPTQEEIAQKMAALSQIIYVKMGDLLLIELHRPVSIKKGETLEVPPLISVRIR